MILLVFVDMKGLHLCNDLQFIRDLWPVTYEGSEFDLMLLSGESETKRC